MKRVIKIIVAVFAVFVMFTGCSKTGENHEIVLADNGGDTQKIKNEMLKIIAENGYEGYSVTTLEATAKENWENLISGKVSLDTECWSTNIPDFLETALDGKVANIRYMTEYSEQGLYIPSYVTQGDEQRGIEATAPELLSVKDLIKYHDIFPKYGDSNKAMIYGGVKGWYADDILYKKYLAYGLDEYFEYINFNSEAELLEIITIVYGQGMPWVGYSYDPSMANTTLDIQRLSDEEYEGRLLFEGLCEFPINDLSIVVNSKFHEEVLGEDGYLLQLLFDIEIRDDLLDEILIYMHDNNSTHEEAARWFLMTYPSLIKGWLEEERANEIISYLNSEK